MGLLSQFGGLIWALVAFVIALSIIVAIHEYGHYIVGRWTGIKADVFSLGFGPVLWSRPDKHGTKWQIAALPFGGYVKFAGDANAASGKDEDAMAAVADNPEALRHTMHGAPLWARALTVLAGPVFNFALSFLLFAGLIFYIGVPREQLTVGQIQALPNAAQGLQEGDVIVGINGVKLPSADEQENYDSFFKNLPLQEVLSYEVLRDEQMLTVDGPYILPSLVGRVGPLTAAYEAGLKSGDVITGVNGKPIFAFDQLKAAVEASNGGALELKVWRAGETLDFTMTPKVTDERQPDGSFEKHLRIGIGSGMAFEPATQSPSVGEALRGGVANTYGTITGSLSALKLMIVGKISTCNLSGPVGIARVSGAAASQGLLSFIALIAGLSTAIGLLNLFPIPALDGGHLVFYAYEAVAGKPPSDGALRILMSVGLSVILMVMVLGLGTDLFCP